MDALAEFRPPALRHRRMDAVVVDHGLAVDHQDRAVVAIEREAVRCIAIDLEEGVELDRVVAVAVSNSEVEATGGSRGVRLQRREVGEFVPIPLVIGVLRRALAGGRDDLRAAAQIRGDGSGLLSVEQPGHSTAGANDMGIFQERGQAGERVFRLEIAQRHGTALDLVLFASRIARAVTGETADLVIEIPAQGDVLRRGPLFAEAPGRGEEVDQRLDLFLRLGIAGEQVRHGGARLGSSRVGKILAQVVDAHPATDVIEDGGLLAPGNCRRGRGS